MTDERPFICQGCGHLKSDHRTPVAQSCIRGCPCPEFYERDGPSKRDGSGQEAVHPAVAMAADALRAELPKPDAVNHPVHYSSDPSGVECITVVEHRNFNIGNAIKYLWRAGLKEGSTTDTDLRKAIWYIERERQRLAKPK